MFNRSSLIVKTIVVGPGASSAYVLPPRTAAQSTLISSTSQQRVSGETPFFAGILAPDPQMP
jgi:hypothetical protein